MSTSTSKDAIDTARFAFVKTCDGPNGYTHHVVAASLDGTVGDTLGQFPTPDLAKEYAAFINADTIAGFSEKAFSDGVKSTMPMGLLLGALGSKAGLGMPATDLAGSTGDAKQPTSADIVTMPPAAPAEAPPFATYRRQVDGTYTVFGVSLKGWKGAVLQTGLTQSQAKDACRAINPDDSDFGASHVLRKAKRGGGYNVWTIASDGTKLSRMGNFDTKQQAEEFASVQNEALLDEVKDAGSDQ